MFASCVLSENPDGDAFTEAFLQLLTGSVNSEQFYGTVRGGVEFKNEFRSVSDKAGRAHKTAVAPVQPFGKNEKNAQ